MRMLLNNSSEHDRAERNATSHPAGLFSRAGIRYEVALDILGSLIAHYAELIGIEHSRPTPDVSIVRQAEAIQRHLRRERNDLDPRNAVEIEAAIAHYAPLARCLYANPQNAPDPLMECAARFRQANASLALEGLDVDDADLALQAQIILGVETGDGAIERYRHRAAANRA